MSSADQVLKVIRIFMHCKFVSSVVLACRLTKALCVAHGYFVGTDIIRMSLTSDVEAIVTVFTELLQL